MFAAYGIPVPAGALAKNEAEALAAAERLKVLAEPRRLLILHFLMEGVQCNCELGDQLDMPFQTTWFKPCTPPTLPAT